jgi:vancomycin resistance protein YoaR
VALLALAAIAFVFIGTYAVSMPLFSLRSSVTTPVALHESAPADVALAEQTEQQPDDLLERQVTVTLSGKDSTEAKAIFSLAEHPEWAVPTEHMFRAVSNKVSPENIAAYLMSGSHLPLPILRNATMSSSAQEKLIIRATTNTIALEGYDIDPMVLAKQIAQALHDGQSHLWIEAEWKKPVVIRTMPDGTQRSYTLLSTGLSDYSGSTVGRLNNVHLAIETHLNNILLPAGETFSIVEAMDAPITPEKGWMEDKGLFGGGAALTYGAGICQSATTMFRAALLAGLPIVQLRNHSLFVDHYEFYGIGLDATMFPGVHDMRFKNDTGEDLLIQAHLENPKVVVNVFGIDDGRTVKMEGPFFVGSKNRPAAMKPLSNHQIGWVRTVTMKNGAELVRPIIATYAKPVWRSIIHKYIGVDGNYLLTNFHPPVQTETK